MKITVVCGNGLGTSLMLEMSIKNILKELGVEARVEHIDLGSAKGTVSDIFIGTKDIAEQLIIQNVNGTIIALENILDKSAMKARLYAVLFEIGKL
ncbi:PTS sugar transporter subunit IIB [Xenorhabdus nematophila]|uniref:Sugar phosphotransferase component II B n=1 Tax=Xenorhabdus nematophila (strain ATCC 19061 / DSM 3370 / CCUG 14189 / LMG 1036 / NCIMB 9965 / AN6) TaxID=406817 RepID=D3VJ24_XENNA|nr:PTS sugar transporter subunit IIB [Xenorhabdus nematophila]AYA39861.1 PTS ascorbate transporter subunit IIB [Xenorhabdus nematophila]KHD29015.1 PTS ascorbate transporter subunit IIB [Xenorhabdus nematophila]MBA0018428.1 PTS sugar transporter subunit IIB [Xenorhabdus nematophila]MCB4425086.1 PTS ascorbate transporter subunit IIB [Xenorhabdus nematophila]QNJ37504.1 PTS sugar transporter subunit IIB [Xenorhabdus nematophila]